MSNEQLRLEHLDDDTLVSFEGADYKLTVRELKKELQKNEDLKNEYWFVIESQEWKPDASKMISGYLQKEYYEMYEGWYEKAMNCVTEADVQEIQKILDKIFSDDKAKKYWSLDKQIFF